jgi:hypothetical protein
MKGTIASTILLSFLTATLVVLGNAARLTAKPGCSDATLRGSYAVHATGTVLSGPNAGPIAFVGAFTYDGMGQLSGNLTIRRNSQTGAETLSKVQYTGSYSVNADCSFDETWTLAGTTSSSVHDADIVDNGTGFVFVNITPGQPTVVSGTGRKQLPGEGNRN